MGEAGLGKVGTCSRMRVTVVAQNELSSPIRGSEPVRGKERRYVHGVVTHMGYRSPGNEEHGHLWGKKLGIK